MKTVYAHALCHLLLCFFLQTKDARVAVNAMMAILGTFAGILAIVALGLGCYGVCCKSRPPIPGVRAHIVHMQSSCTSIRKTRAGEKTRLSCHLIRTLYDISAERFGNMAVQEYTVYTARVRSNYFFQQFEAKKMPTEVSNLVASAVLEVDAK